MISPEPGFRLVAAPDAYRMVALHSHRITVAKADEIVGRLAHPGRRAHPCGGGLGRAQGDRALLRDPGAPAGSGDLQATAKDQLQGLRRAQLPRLRGPGLERRVSVTDCHPAFDDAGEKVELREALEEVCVALGV